MRMILKELLDVLGVGYIMGPYATCPWSVYDPEKGLTCNAEVRMNEDGNALEAEIMVFYETPPAGQPSLDLVFRLDCKVATQDKWEACKLMVKGNEKTNAFHDWDKKACAFFHACVQELKMNQIPDIDALLKKELDEGGDSTTMMRGGGSKSPKIKPQALLGMKGGRGF